MIEVSDMGIFSKKIKPFIIGVCGRSCSGKSTVIKELEEKYKGEFLHVIQDKFFKVKADNWESPDSLRFDKLIETIKKIPKSIDVVLTGRYASQKIIDMADYVNKIIYFANQIWG